MSGWFAVKRGITSHPLFKGNPERLAIWLWLLDNAVWQDTPHDIKGKTVIVRRGQVCAAERRVALEVGVGYQVVRTFLARLKAEHMINAQVTQGRNIITLCNYEKYQNSNAAANASPNAELTQSQRIKEQDNNSSKEEAASRTLTQRLWGEGLEVLKRGGMTDKAARNYLGKLRKEHKDETVLAALMAADRNGSSDVAAYVRKTANRKTHSADDWLEAQGIRDLDGGDDDTRGNFSGGNRAPATRQHDTDDLSDLLGYPQKEAGPMPVREYVQ